MKITIMMITGIICSIGQCYAQGLLNQNATERRYQLEQIATLKAYSKLLKKGYNTVKDGTRLIGNIKNGELGLHTAYFNSLKAVNPAIKNDSRISGILKMQSAMVGQRQSIMHVATDTRIFSSFESRNIEGILEQLSQQASEDLDELELVITDGKLQMTDDERIKEIGKLYSLTQEKYSYQKRLGRNIAALAAARQQGATDADLLKTLYGTGN